VPYEGWAVPEILWVMVTVIHTLHKIDENNEEWSQRF